MKPLDEVPHLLSAYRQLGDEGRRRLVKRILGVAVEKAGLSAADDFDRLVSACLRIARSGNTVEKASAELVQMCVHWLEAPGVRIFDDRFFTLIAVQYGRTDTQMKLRAGRLPGALGAKGKYIEALRLANPEATAVELYGIALSEADSDNSPFGNEDGVLYDKAREQLLPREQFAKKLPPKNPRKR